AVVQLGARGERPFRDQRWEELSGRGCRAVSVVGVAVAARIGASNGVLRRGRSYHALHEQPGGTPLAVPFARQLVARFERRGKVEIVEHGQSMPQSVNALEEEPAIAL